MPLEPGTTLGPYSVTAKIGEGGMGEVYRARDTKLDRDVALKVLPEAFTQDPDRLARFEREAKVLASLNHPNIAQIHGLEESDGVRALVLELVEGPTLADRIKQGAIPLDEALPIAKQIAEALEAAHEKGIIHRDLKPANIKVRDDGMVKVLDFGLAKAFQPDASDPGLSQSPTISLTAAATQMGMVIGTAAYMAPEQAKGKVVDKRADVWAFGAVLYEMLSGKKPFEGDDVSDTLALVLKFEPDWDALPSDTPARLRQLVQTCLQKNPKQRVHDVADVRLAMEGAFEARDEAPSAAVVPLALHAWQRPIPAAIAALVIAVAGAMAWSLANPAPVPSGTVTRFPFFPPEGDSMDRGDGIALSPDGTTLVYTSLSDGVRRLYVRTRDQMTVRPLPGTERARMPFFSPDGAWVGFFAVGELKKVALVGGPSVTLCEAGPPSGATWGQDDKIVFTSLGALGLMQVSAAGGEPRLLTEAVAGATHAWPAFVPGGKAVLFTIRQEESLGAYEVAVVSLDTGEQQTLLRGTDGAVTASGHLVFARAASLWAVPFDTDRLTVFGEPTPMVEGVQVSAGGWAHYTLADDGTLIYRPAGGGLRRSLAWVDRDGAQEPINVPPRAYTYARLSPDGGLIALDSRDDESDIWIWDVERETLQRLTRDPGMNRGPVWSPDGQQIAFTAVRDGTESIHWQAADGSGAPEPLSTETGFPFGFRAIPSVNKRLVLELARSEYLDRRENVLALGNSGTGKTHLALAWGLAACQKGYRVRFTTAAALVNELLEARDDKRLLRFQKQLAKQDLLIVDELGYVPLSKTGAELLFEIFSQRYEQASTLVTSNLPFNEWTEIFGSERLTGALLDRLTHHVHILELNGESYRLEHSKKARQPAATPAS